MADSTVSVFTGSVGSRSGDLRRSFLQARRVFSRVFLRGFFNLLTNTRVEGLENIPDEGPLLVLPNHLSNLDGPLLLAMYPRALEMLGPRDFKMEPFKSALMSMYGMTLIRRGFTDSEAVNEIVRHLRQGKHLLMFPSGGMWEKRSFTNKSGAAYFSQLTRTPILPVGISGTYLQSHRTLSVHSPSPVLRFGKVIDPVSREGNKSKRELRLNEANEELERSMYDLLEPSERERYERWNRETYSMEVLFRREDRIEAVYKISDGFLPTLAEFAIKPNLFRPMWKHAGKDMSILLKPGFATPARVNQTALDLFNNLTSDFSRYLPYRLGDEAQTSALYELAVLKDLCTEASACNAEIKLTPTATDPETGEIRTAPRQ